MNEEEFLENINLEELQKEDLEYNDILNLLDNKHIQEKYINDEELEETTKEEEEYKLTSLEDIINNEENNKK